MFVVKRPRYGVDKVLDEIEGMFLNSPYFRNRMYQIWLSLEAKDRKAIRYEIKIGRASCRERV